MRSKNQQFNICLGVSKTFFTSSKELLFFTIYASWETIHKMGASVTSRVKVDASPREASRRGESLYYRFITFPSGTARFIFSSFK